MSEYVGYKGKLTKISKRNITNEELSKLLSQEKELNKKYYNTWLEQLLDINYKDYFYDENKDILYKMEYEKIDVTERYDMDEEEGNYYFDVIYYDGGCSFEEALLEAFKKMKS